MRINWWVFLGLVARIRMSIIVLAVSFGSIRIDICSNGELFDFESACNVLVIEDLDKLLDFLKLQDDNMFIFPTLFVKCIYIIRLVRS